MRESYMMGVRLLSSLLAVAFLAGLLLPTEALAKKTRYDKVIADAPELRDFQMPDVTREVLDNGMVVYLVEDHDLPLIRLNARIRVGSIYEPAPKVGLASVMAEVMRTGGTADLPGDDLDVFLENLGASVETGMSAANGSATMRCLSENLAEVLPVFAAVLREPAFPAEKIDLAKTQEKTAISRRNDDASQIAWREIFKLYFGEKSPYARQTEYDTIDAIERGDLVDFHEYFYHPNNIILIAGGDFDTAEMLGQLKQAFGDWPMVETFFPPDPVITETEPSINYVFKEDVNQSKIRMGHMGIKHDDEYRFELEVLNQILGGGLASRLFTEIRSKRELAYSVFAWMIVGDHHRMPFIVGVDTKSESTVEAIEALMHEVRRVTEEEVTEVEIERAKSGLKNSFVFNFSSPFSIARQKANYEFWGMDPDFLDTYLDKVNAVTPAKILTAAKARIRPDDMAIIVVGKAEDFDQPLSVLGEVNEIDITIPEPSFAEVELPEMTDENLAEGRSLMEKALAACGGAKVVAGITALEMAGDLTVETPMGAMTFNLTSRSKGDDKLRMDTNTPFGNMVQVLNGDQGWMKSPQGLNELGEAERQDLRDSEKRELAKLFKELDRYQAQAVGVEELDGAEYKVVYLHEEDGTHTKLFLDPATNMIKAMEYRDQGQTGPVLNLTTLGDYRKVDGFSFPFEYKVKHDGTLFATMNMTSIKVNLDLEDGLFSEPE